MTITESFTNVDIQNGWKVSAENADPTNAHAVTIWIRCLVTDPGTVIAKAGGFKVAKKGK